MFKPAFVSHYVSRDGFYIMELCTVFEINPEKFLAVYSCKDGLYDDMVKSATFDTIEEAFAWCVEQSPLAFE